MIYNEVEKQFDGEHNVLFQTLHTELFSDDIHYASNSRTEMENYEEALKAFFDKEGVDYYPQIYIPFYEELQKRKSNSNYEEKPPVIILLIGDSQQDVFEGYQLQEGEFKKTSFQVNEAYAQEHEVWVISLNERYFGETSSTSNSNNGATNGRTENEPSAWIENMTCKCHKESWAAGGSEVNIITVVSDWGFNHPDSEVRTYGGGDHEGGCIKKFKRKDVKKENSKEVNFSVLNRWNFRMPNTPFGSYVIFEYDTWPTGKQEALWYHGSNSYSWKYRSADTYYDLNVLHNTSFNGYTVNNSCIEWNGLYY